MIGKLKLLYQNWKTEPQDSEPLAKDELGWNEKIPLTLALIAQSYVIFNWYLASVKGIEGWVDFVVAITAGIALDLIVVTTTMGRREGRESHWSHLAAFGAFVCSALIALKVYGAVAWLPEGWLHIAFPLEVWLYSQHLATPKRTHRKTSVAIQPIAAPSLPAPKPALGSLIDELKQDAAPIKKTPQRAPRKAQKPGRAHGNINKLSRVRSALDEHGDMENTVLYEMFPDVSQSGVRNTAKTWRDEKKAAMNGHSG